MDTEIGQFARWQQSAGVDNRQSIGMAFPGMSNPGDPPCLLIVWHSRTGASETMAEMAAHGARDAAGGDIGVKCLSANEAGAHDVLGANAYLFVCPENLGTMSGAMKEFFDRTYYPALDQITGRAYATIIAAGSDGSGAQRQLDRIVTGWRLRRVAEPLIVNFEAQTPEAILAQKEVSKATHAQCREMGAALASGLQLGIF